MTNRPRPASPLAPAPVSRDAWEARFTAVLARQGFNERDFDRSAIEQAFDSGQDAGEAAIAFVAAWEDDA